MAEACSCWACRVGKQIVNVPSFMVRVDSQKHIDFALNSPFGGGRPGRNKRRSVKCAPALLLQLETCLSVGASDSLRADL